MSLNLVVGNNKRFVGSSLGKTRVLQREGSVFARLDDSPPN